MKKFVCVNSCMKNLEVEGCHLGFNTVSKVVMHYVSLNIIKIQGINPK